VVKGDHEAKIWLEPSVSVAENYGFSQKELSVIIKIVKANLEKFLKEYQKWHGR
jgi:hypothetical protein